MANIELLVYSSGLTSGYGRIKLHGNEPINIKMAVADIKDIKSRKSTFTQSFSIPGNEANNKLFSHIFEIGIDSQFDPRKKTPCSLIVDSIPVMRNGILQLTDIAVDKQNNIEYQVSVFDNTQNLIDNIGDLELTDLNWSDLDHIWNYTNTINSWTGTSQPYFYPLIDYGYDYNLADMNTGMGVGVEQLFPAIQGYTTLDRIFEAAGYSWDSDFLESEYFKNLYLPFNGSPALNQEPTFAIDRSFLAHYTGQTATTIDLAVSTFPATYGVATRTPLTFEDDVNYPNFDNGALYNPLTSVYTSNTYSIQTFTVTLQSQFTVSGPSYFSFNGGRHYVRFYRSSYMGGVNEFYTASDSPGTSLSAITTTSYSTPPLNDSSHPQLYPCRPNETFWVKYDFSFNYGAIPTTGYTVTHTLYSSGTSFYNTVSTQAILGQLMNYSSFIPKKIKQIDFFNSLTTMHNLYITASRDNAKKLKIIPRDDYYANGVTKNWSGKVDLTNNITEQLLSEQSKKQYIFTYKTDKDYYNTDYSTATNKIFGDDYIIIDNEFTKDDKKIEVIFSPTPSIPVLDSGGFVPVGANPLVCNEFVIPKIGKVDGNNNFGRTDFNIRILQKNPDNLLPLTGTNTWMLSGQTFNNFPYLGMLNHPLTGTTDIAFGSVDYVYYTLNSITDNNLVNKYWRSYLNQISDKNSKLITAYFYLTPADIADFDFSDTIYVEGLTPEGGHYFIVNSIDYSPTSNGPSKVELIKAKKQYIDITTSRIVPSIYKPLPLQSIALGGGQTFSTGSIAIGPDSVIGAGSPRSFIMGEGNTIEGGAPRSMIIGSGSTILGTAQGSMVFGDGITASTPNTVYVPNIVISSGGTINGLPLSAITSGSTLWAAGSGTGSVKQNNGTGNIASGNYSIAEGGGTIATGDTAHAEGTLTIANGYAAHAEGITTTAYGYGAHAEGELTISNAYTSHAEGYGTTASGDTSHAEGESSVAGGYAAHAEGTTRAFGNYSHSEGLSTIASGNASHAEGDSTTASGNASHSEGINTTASGNYSHAGGIYTIASGNHSFVHGSGSTASSSGTIVLGNGITGTSGNTVYVSNLVISGNVTSLPVLSRVYLTSGTQNINTATAKLRMSGITYDTGNNYDSVNGRFIAPTSSYYQVNAVIATQVNSGIEDFFILLVRKNGVTDTSSSTIWGNNPSDFNSIYLSDIIQLNAGDYIELWGQAGGDFNILDTTDQSWWTVNKLI